MSASNIALNRFGLGARADERSPANPKAWLLDQFAAFAPAVAAAPSTATVASDLGEYQRLQQLVRQSERGTMQRAQGMAADLVPADAMALAVQLRQQGRQHYVASVGARINAALVTAAPFVERLVHFWANHFALSADKLVVTPLTGPFEFEGVRPHVLGKFGDMLIAVEQHPGMLLYLDQAQSVGPNSPLGSLVAARQAGQGRKVGLNENLAREIMELHTLGVRTGYSQADVTELARAMTGWTVGGLGRGIAARAAGVDGAAAGDFVFADRLHEPGARTILGQRYDQQGEGQARAVLSDLAVHPATAKHIATKLVRHFVADDPPPGAVAKVEAAFLKSGGDLPTVYRALVELPEAWAPAPAKFKTPWEWSVSALRGLGTREVGGQQAVGLLQQLGQPTWQPGSPAGWDDIAPSWAGPDAIMRRVEAAERFASRTPGVDARARAAQLFPDAVGAATSQAIARAESPAQALALLLVAPEFLRR